jgi:hypothetical protein
VFCAIATPFNSSAAATSEIIFLMWICYSIFALVVSCVESGGDIVRVRFLVRAEKRCASN